MTKAVPSDRLSSDAIGREPAAMERPAVDVVTTACHPIGDRSAASLALAAVGLSVGEVMAQRRHLKIVHHLPGRLRLRLKLSPVFPGSASAGSIACFVRLVEQMAGVRRVRLSPETLSAVVEYDHHRLRPALWAALITGGETAGRSALDRMLSSVSDAGGHASMPNFYRQDMSGTKCKQGRLPGRTHPAAPERGGRHRD